MGSISVRIDFERCKACGYCIDVCPKTILRFSIETNSKGYYYAVAESVQECTGCRFCALMCPEVAIRIVSSRSEPMDS